MKFKATALALMVSGMFLTGCTNSKIEEYGEIERNNFEQMIDKALVDAKNIWGKDIVAIEYSPRTNGLFAKRENVAPTSLLSKRIEGVSFTGDMTLGTLTRVIGDKFNVNLMVPDENLREKSVDINNFRGSLAQLIFVLEDTFDMNIAYMTGNSFIARASERYIVSVPNNESVAAAIESDITGLGAKEVKVNVLSGSLSYNASARVQKDIDAYIERFYNNFASVRMQVTVFSVSLDESFAEGFDWSQINTVLGDVSAAVLNSQTGIGQLLNASSDTTDSSTTTDFGDTSSSDSSSDSDDDYGLGTGFNENALMEGSGFSDINSYISSTGGQLGLGAFNSTIAIDMTIDWLNQYGTTKTNQSFFIETHTGIEASVESKRNIPFNSAPTSNVVASSTPIVQNSAETDNREVGVTMSVTPYFDSSSSEVIVNMDVELATLVGTESVDLGDGQSIRQPSVQTQQFPTALRMKAGETKVFGGIIFDSVIEDGNNPYFLDDYESLDYKSQALSKSALFVVIRPTVVVFNKSEKVK